SHVQAVTGHFLRRFLRQAVHLADQLVSQLQQPLVELGPFRLNLYLTVLLDFDLVARYWPAQDGRCRRRTVGFIARRGFLAWFFFLCCHSSNCRIIWLSGFSIRATLPF